MKRISLYIILLLSYSAMGQKTIVGINAYDFGYSQPVQTVQNDIVLKYMPRVKNITLPSDLLASIYRKGNIERTINVYGQSLIIESAESLPGGKIQLILRREDGRDFYNLYPLVKAEITHQNINNSEQIPSL